MPTSVATVDATESIADFASHLDVLVASLIGVKSHTVQPSADV